MSSDKISGSVGPKGNSSSTLSGEVFDLLIYMRYTTAKVSPAPVQRRVMNRLGLAPALSPGQIHSLVIYREPLPGNICTCGFYRLSVAAGHLPICLATSLSFIHRDRHCFTLSTDKESWTLKLFTCVHDWIHCSPYFQTHYVKNIYSRKALSAY